MRGGKACGSPQNPNWAAGGEAGWIPSKQCHPRRLRVSRDPLPWHLQPGYTALPFPPSHPGGVAKLLWAINSGARHWRCINRVGRRAAEQRADQLRPKLTYYLYSGAPGIAPTLAPTAPRDLDTQPMLGNPHSAHSDPTESLGTRAIQPESTIPALSSLPRRTQGPAVYRWVEELHIWRETLGKREGGSCL